LPVGFIRVGTISSGAGASIIIASAIGTDLERASTRIGASSMPIGSRLPPLSQALKAKAASPASQNLFCQTVMSIPYCNNV
jgi:hypothetical protein